METISSPVTVTVTFKAADGSVVPAPADIVLASTTPGVDTFSLDLAARNEDGSYNLTVTPVAVGTDTIAAAGLTGSLAVSVTEPIAVSVDFLPSSV